jgi:hypothetical protein
MQQDRTTPRALLNRTLITVQVTASELHTLIEALETKAAKAAEDGDQIDFADFLYRRCAELREACR